MRFYTLRHSFRLFLIGAVCLAAATGGCSRTKAPPRKMTRYESLPAKTVPDFLKGTVLERTDLGNTEPFHVSAFGLVGNLHGTGDSTAPGPVRDYMKKEMARHGYGTYRLRGYENLGPEEVLRDNHFAIVQVDGFIPVGARKGQMFDTQVSCLPKNETSSLARGNLYETELRIGGADWRNPDGSVNVFARSQGPIFVNPAYAIEDGQSETAGRTSLRNGLVMNGGIVQQDRPILLRLRQPQFSMTRAIERRINDRFQNSENQDVAAAQDEGIISFFVPHQYKGDWEHFSNVVTHLYLNGSAEFAAAKAQQLAEEAVKPDAPLLDISYCWEGLGPKALPFILPLMNHSSPDVAFAAARAAAFIGNGSTQTTLVGNANARQALMEMAATAGHPNQLAAVQVLGALANSPQINQSLQMLLASEQTPVRLEAYRILAENNDSSIVSKVVKGKDGQTEKFILDIVRCDGPPLIHATRRGWPRIAIFGNKAALNKPIMFAAFDNTFTITSASDVKGLVLYYRGPELRKPVKVPTSPDLAVVAARLGGEGAPGSDRLDFTYGDVVGLLMNLATEQKVSAIVDGRKMPMAFVLEQIPALQDAIQDAPIIPDAGRPQGELRVNADEGVGK